MYDLKRMERLKAIMERHSNVSPSNRIDTRPASGMVGQRCDGYVQDQSGRLIRVAEAPRNSSFVGPGSYDPKKPSSTHAIKMSTSARKTILWNASPNPGPCDYCHEPKSTKYLHSIVRITEQPAPEPPLGGNLGPTSWGPPPPGHVSRRQHPNVHPKKDMRTSQFQSKTSREIFPQKYKSPGPVVHAKQRPPVEFIADEDDEEEDGEKKHAERLIFTPSCAPCCTTYTLPDEFGKGRGTTIARPMDELYKAKPFIMPDCAQYAGEVICGPANKDVPSPSFRTRTQRFVDAKSDTPAPGDYEIGGDIRKDGKRQTIPVKRERRVEKWYDIPQRHTPAVGEYNPYRPIRPKSGYISTIGHADQPITQEDHPLAFRTQHSSLIKKSYNARYFNVGR